MNKFKELQLEQTRAIGDGVQSATLMNVTGASGSLASGNSVAGNPPGVGREAGDVSIYGFAVGAVGGGLVGLGLGGKPGLVIGFTVGGTLGAVGGPLDW